MIVKYGYVRVSTKDQNENRQLEAMKQLEILKKNIYVEKISGKDFDRPIYQKWKEGKITGVVAADACGMPVSTFLYKARAYEKVEK